MSATTTKMDRTDRNILDHFKEGVGLRTIALRVNLEFADVQDIVQTLAGGSRSTAAALVAAYDKQATDAPDEDQAAAVRDAELDEAAAVAEQPPAAPKAADLYLDAAAAPAAAAADHDGWAGLDKAMQPVIDQAARAMLADAEAEQRGDQDLAPTVEPINLATPAPDDMPSQPINLDDWGDLDDPRDDEEATETAAAIVAAPELGDRIEALVAEQHALAGPTEQLPEVASFDELTAAAATAGVPDLAALVGQARRAVDELHERYALERRTRAIRAEAAQLRAQLDAQLAELYGLTGGAQLPVPTSPAAPAGPMPVDLTDDKATRDAIRAWAHRNGKHVADKGVIPPVVVAAWWEATGGQQ